MDIQTNIDILLQADLKDWHHYENQRKLQELREQLEQVTNSINTLSTERSVVMIIKIAEDGTVKWQFYRKSYKKARWRKLGARLLADFKKDAGAHGLIFVVWNR